MHCALSDPLAFEEIHQFLSGVVSTLPEVEATNVDDGTRTNVILTSAVPSTSCAFTVVEGM